MTSDELLERLIDFAVRVGKVVDALPDTRMVGTSRDNLFVAALRLRRIMMKVVRLKVARTSFIS